MWAKSLSECALSTVNTCMHAAPLLAAFQMFQSSPSDMNAQGSRAAPEAALEASPEPLMAVKRTCNPTPSILGGILRGAAQQSEPHSALHPS